MVTVESNHCRLPHVRNVVQVSHGVCGDIGRGTFTYSNPSLCSCPSDEIRHVVSQCLQYVRNLCYRGRNVDHSRVSVSERPMPHMNESHCCKRYCTSCVLCLRLALFAAGRAQSNALRRPWIRGDRQAVLLGKRTWEKATSEVVMGSLEMLRAGLWLRCMGGVRWEE